MGLSVSVSQLFFTSIGFAKQKLLQRYIEKNTMIMSFNLGAYSYNRAKTKFPFQLFKGNCQKIGRVVLGGFSTSVNWFKEKAKKILGLDLPSSWILRLLRCKQKKAACCLKPELSWLMNLSQWETLWQKFSEVRQTSYLGKFYCYQELFLPHIIKLTFHTVGSTMSSVAELNFLSTSSVHLSLRLRTPVLI